MDWLALIGIVLPTLLQLLSLLTKSKEEIRNDQRQDIVSGNSDAVSARIGQVLSETDSGNAGGEGGEIGTGATDPVEGLAALGISVEQSAGSGGKEEVN